jgi:thioredoxin-dependent peroxiredoxin
LPNTRGNTWFYFFTQKTIPLPAPYNLRDNYALLKKEGFEVLGISPDDEKKHKKFEAKFLLPFTLIADPTHTIIDKYGVWGEKQLYGRNYMGLHRTTFIVNPKGIIEKIFLRPKNKQHAAEIIAAIKK